MSRYSKRKKEETDTDRQKDDSIIESIELTAQLEDSLRKLINSRRHQEQTVKRQGQGHGVISLRDEVRLLRQDNAELQADNEQICRDMLRLQQESREFKKEVAEHKKCIAHLQGYNGELKKELMYWMRKPNGGGSLHLKQKTSQQDDQEGQEQELMCEIEKLRRENHLKERQLRSVEETVSLKKLKVSLLPKQISLHTGKQTSLHLGSQSKLTKGVKSAKNESNKTMQVSKRGDLCTSCTSCNYLQYSGNKKRRPRPVSVILPQALSESQKMKRRGGTRMSGLCDCHQHYVDTSRFK